MKLPDLVGELLGVILRPEAECIEVHLHRPGACNVATLGSGDGLKSLKVRFGFAAGIEDVLRTLVKVEARQWSKLSFLYG